MPQATTITIDDRESSPVAHVFTPSGEDANGVWQFLNNAIEETVGRESLTIGLKRGTRNRVQMRLTLPVMATETINGVSNPTIVRYNRATVEFTFDENSSLQERKNTIGLTYNALAASQTAIDSVLTNVEDFY
jgi:hypothetical protein